MEAKHGQIVIRDTVTNDEITINVSTSQCSDNRPVWRYVKEGYHVGLDTDEYVSEEELKDFDPENIIVSENPQYSAYGNRVAVERFLKQEYPSTYKGSFNYFRIYKDVNPNSSSHNKEIRIKDINKKPFTDFIGWKMIRPLGDDSTDLKKSPNGLPVIIHHEDVSDDNVLNKRFYLNKDYKIIFDKNVIPKLNDKISDFDIDSYSKKSLRNSLYQITSNNTESVAFAQAMIDNADENYNVLSNLLFSLHNDGYTNDALEVSYSFSDVNGKDTIDMNAIVFDEDGTKFKQVVTTTYKPLQDVFTIGKHNNVYTEHHDFITQTNNDIDSVYEPFIETSDESLSIGSNIRFTHYPEERIDGYLFEYENIVSTQSSFYNIPYLKDVKKIKNDSQIAYKVENNIIVSKENKNNILKNNTIFYNGSNYYSFSLCVPRKNGETARDTAFSNNPNANQELVSHRLSDGIIEKTLRIVEGNTPNIKTYIPKYKIHGFTNYEDDDKVYIYKPDSNGKLCLIGWCTEKEFYMLKDEVTDTTVIQGLVVDRQLNFGVASNNIRYLEDNINYTVSDSSLANGTKINLKSKPEIILNGYFVTAKEGEYYFKQDNCAMACLNSYNVYYKVENNVITEKIIGDYNYPIIYDDDNNLIVNLTDTSTDNVIDIRRGDASEVMCSLAKNENKLYINQQVPPEGNYGDYNQIDNCSLDLDTHHEYEFGFVMSSNGTSTLTCIAIYDI